MQKSLAAFVALIAVGVPCLGDEDRVPDVYKVREETVDRSIATLFTADEPRSADATDIAIRRIEPVEIVQSSIRVRRFSTNGFVVGWVYTGAGATNMLAFEEAHGGQDVRMVVGNFERKLHMGGFRSMPPAFTNYMQWKEGWLKSRTDKIWVTSEQDAKTIREGLSAE